MNAHIFGTSLQSAIAYLLLVLLLASQSTVLCQTSPTPEGSAPVIQQQGPHREALPVGWKIAIVALGAMGTGFAIAFAMRAWRSSNLFDRQYRFPALSAGALRLGANKTGGSMATIEFRHKPK